MNTPTLAELAERIGAELVGDGSLRVTGPASLADAGPDEVSFLAQPRYRSLLAETRAAGVVVGRDVAQDVTREREDPTFLVHDDPNAAFTRVIQAFVPDDEPPRPGVHPSAVVEPGAEVDPTAIVGPFCHLARDAKVGAGAWLVSRVTVGLGASVGVGTVLHPGVALYAHVRVGERCIVHAGTVIGSDGYGFEPAPPAGWTKVPQCGTVVVEDDVELRDQRGDASGTDRRKGSPGFR